MAKKKSIAKETIALFMIMAVAGFVVTWLELEKQSNQNKIKSCDHWVFEYHFRGRMNRDVLCADSLYITDRGQYEELPWHLKEMQDKINKRYRYIQQRKSLVNRDHLFPNREE